MLEAAPSQDLMHRTRSSLPHVGNPKAHWAYLEYCLLLVIRQDDLNITPKTYMDTYTAAHASFTSGLSRGARSGKRGQEFYLQFVQIMEEYLTKLARSSAVRHDEDYLTSVLNQKLRFAKLAKCTSGMLRYVEGHWKSSASNGGSIYPGSVYDICELVWDKVFISGVQDRVALEVRRTLLLRPDALTIQHQTIRQIVCRALSFAPTGSLTLRPVCYYTKPLDCVGDAQRMTFDTTWLGDGWKARWPTTISHFALGVEDAEARSFTRCMDDHDAVPASPEASRERELSSLMPGFCFCVHIKPGISDRWFLEARESATLVRVLPTPDLTALLANNLVDASSMRQRLWEVNVGRQGIEKSSRSIDVSKDGWTRFHVGFTCCTNDDIEDLACEVQHVMGEHYRGISNNCQTFCNALLQCIRTPRNENDIQQGIEAVPVRVRDRVLVRRTQEVANLTNDRLLLLMTSKPRTPATIEKTTVWIICVLISVFMAQIPALWKKLESGQFILVVSTVSLLSVHVWTEHLGKWFKACITSEDAAMVDGLRVFVSEPHGVSNIRQVQTGLTGMQEQHVPGGWVDEAYCLSHGS